MKSEVDRILIVNVLNYHDSLLLLLQHDTLMKLCALWMLCLATSARKCRASSTTQRCISWTLLVRYFKTCLLYYVSLKYINDILCSCMWKLLKIYVYIVEHSRQCGQSTQPSPTLTAELRLTEYKHRHYLRCLALRAPSPYAMKWNGYFDTDQLVE